jgi:hypothetical protein
LEGSRGASWTGQLACWVEVEGPGTSAARVKGFSRDVKKISGTMHGGGRAGSASAAGAAAAEEKTPIKASKSGISSCMVADGNDQRRWNMDRKIALSWNAIVQAGEQRWETKAKNGLKASHIYI